MEVESRVSVQAIKGRFEQLYEDGPQSPTNTNTTNNNTSSSSTNTTYTIRPRAASLTTTKREESPRSEEYDVRKTIGGKKLVNSDDYDVRKTIGGKKLAHSEESDSRRTISGKKLLHSEEYDVRKTIGGKKLLHSDDIARKTSVESLVQGEGSSSSSGGGRVYTCSGSMRSKSVSATDSPYKHVRCEDAMVVSRESLFNGTNNNTFLSPTTTTNKTNTKAPISPRKHSRNLRESLLDTKQTPVSSFRENIEPKHLVGSPVGENADTKNVVGLTRESFETKKNVVGSFRENLLEAKRTTPAGRPSRVEVGSDERQVLNSSVVNGSVGEVKPATSVVSRRFPAFNKTSDAKVNNSSFNKTSDARVNNSSFDKMSDAKVNNSADGVKKLHTSSHVEDSEEEKDKDSGSVVPQGGIRGRLFSHIRSRSHGNFIVKRGEDSSVERNTTTHTSTHQKDNVFHRDTSWLTPKRKQRSTDNLLNNNNNHNNNNNNNNEDSNSNSTFEGKQKLVAHVVRNMKNRDKPTTALRKLSFTSKMEKELKNMKEKSYNPEPKPRTIIGGISTTRNNTTRVKQKIINGKSTTTTTTETKDSPERRKVKKLHCGSGDSSLQAVPVAIAKEVADVALRKCGNLTTTDVHLSSSNDNDDNNEVKSGADPESHKTTNTEDTEVIEGLPAGPPPKKPPRTFAYDIYKNTKPSKRASQSQKSSGVDVNKSTESDPCSPPPPPIYAVPVKKKSRCNNNNNCNNNSFSPKPPIRSKSDLSKQDVVSPKPSVAPKPPHILAKAKRASLVDPISSYDNNNKEGDEEEQAAITSEFQRQAHIRYSLRRPKKPPAPTPPTTTTTTTFTTNQSEDSSSSGGVNNDTRGTTKTTSSLNTSRRHSLNIHNNNNNNTETTSTSERDHQVTSSTQLSSPSSYSSSSSYTNNNNNNNTNNTRDYENVHYRNSNNNKSPKDIDKKEEEEEKKKQKINNIRPHSNSHQHYHYFPHQTTTTTSPDYEDVLSAPTPIRSSSFSAQNLQTPPPPPPIQSPSSPSFLDSDQPMSLGGGYCSVGTSLMTPSAVDTMGLSTTKRSMSDETLYKGSRRCCGDEPVYATPNFNPHHHLTDGHHRELHYMCSVLFTDDDDDEEDGDGDGLAGGRDGGNGDGRGRRSSKDKILLSSTSTNDSSSKGAGRAGLISAWKREFRQSCRQMQNKIKKTVIR
ncbi:hypothetical protein Pmani_032126 [Petrolisthes manimaculis]|uniref:Uncharacterized protein n=1 Tax=Petrolisthes manimaculis TaxID=1843537 RepID=A0AAE1NUB1_9EUCA|nr:hypothetical protein Pmani_032126 [Petrolisthes manimaculis]